jgi:hypothetical protein
VGEQFFKTYRKMCLFALDIAHPLLIIQIS